jgi:hypothetical protein
MEGAQAIDGTHLAAHELSMCSKRNIVKAFTPQTFHTH